LPSIAFTATATQGTTPLTVTFAATNVDSGGLPISTWNWSFGDRASSDARNPTHTYATADTFYPILFATNSRGVTVIGLGPSAIAAIPPIPIISDWSASGGNLTFNVTNGVTDATYELLTSTNLELPLGQWTPVATTVLQSSGNFQITAGNPVSSPVPQQFFTLQCYGSFPHFPPVDTNKEPGLVK
jgi:hypothetical protein